MAENTREIDAPADCVWAVLADPDVYAVWVVGARDIRDWEGEWPEAGAKFHHTQGFGPVALVKDETEAIESEPGRRLLLEARARPFAILRIELVIEPLGPDRTLLRMNEWPVGGFVAPLARLVDVGLKLRNVESLERLTALAEQRWRGRQSALAGA